MQKVSNGHFCIFFYISPLQFWRISEHFISYGPVAGKHSNRRSLPYASSMAYLGSTTGRHRHGVGKREGEREQGRGRIWGKGGAESDGTGNGQGTAGGEAGESGEGGGGEKKEEPLVGCTKMQ